MNQEEIKTFRDKRIAKNNKLRELCDKHYEMLTTIAFDFKEAGESFRVETIYGEFTFHQNLLPPPHN